MALANANRRIVLRARIEGFVVTDFQHRFAEGRAWLGARMAGGADG